MKTIFKRVSTSTLAIVLTICMLISCMTAAMIATDAAKLTGDSAVAAKTDDTAKVGANVDSEAVGSYSGGVVYLKPNSNWLSANQRFAVYYFNGSNNGWVDMAVASGETDIYKATVPSGTWDNLIFCRMNGSTTENNWNNKWNQTGDVSPASGKNMYTITAGNDEWGSNGSWSAYIPQDTPVFSLVGNISSDYIVNSSIAESSLSNDTLKWGTHYSAFDVNTGSAGVYSITFTTVADLGSHNSINIGLFMDGIGQYGFRYNGTDYNSIGADLTIPSTGVSSGLYVKKGQGSIVLQANTTYTITIDQTDRTQTGCVGKMTITETPSFELHLGTTNVDSNWAQAKAGDMTLNGSVYEYTASLSASTYGYYVTTYGAGEKRGLYYKSSASSGTHSATLGTAESVGEYLAKEGSSWGGSQCVFKYTPTSAGDYKFTFDLANKTLKIERVSASSGDATWPPTGINPASYSGDDNTEIIYLFGSDATGLTDSNVSTLAPKVHVGNDYWVDLTDEISKTQNNRLYITITSNGRNSDGFYAGSGGSVDITHAPGVASGGINNHHFNNNAKYFAYVAFDQPNNITHLGVLIHKDSSNNCTYTVYTTTSASEPVTETQVVDIIAKNGTLRDNNFNRFTNLADTNIEDYFYYSEMVEGNLTEYNSISAYNTAHSGKPIVVTHNFSYGSSSYDSMTNVPVGAKIKISTELSNTGQTFRGSEKFSDTHYLKAYSFNGMTYKVFKAADGVATTNGKKFTEEWTVRAVNTTYHDANDVLQNATTNGNTVEVTPIYYMQDSSNCKTFYIDGYDGEVQNAWGNMLAVYPYYENISGKNNAFGGYPGQPMLFWGGKYQMEIPLTVDGTASGASVKGLTLHNGYWDLLHRSIDIRCNARNHAQTYDYDDFYKLYKEKNPDTIIFDFKYKTANDNFGDGYDYFNYDFAGTSGSEPTKDAAYYAASGKNGVELVTDYFGRQVDAFGTLIADANKSHYGEDNNGTPIGQTNELLFVSTGYKDTYVGEYATLWAVYAPNGSFIGYISSSMLYLNNWDRRLQYTDGDSTANGRMSWAAFQTTYNTLKTSYTGVPALISYEKEIWNDSKDKANRSDGKWYYSNKSDKVSASIKIQYGSHTLLDAPDHSVSSSAWYDDPFDQSQTGVGGEKNIGTSTGCSAYFTNTNPNLLGHVESGEQFADSTKSFTFEAVAGGSYMFAGWVRYSNGKYYEISESEVGESPMSANDVYIARFVDAQTGSLSIQHVVEQTDTFNGTGTPSITVTVKNGGTDVTGSPYIVSDGSKIDISKWIDSHFASYTIDISLTTTPSNESFMKNIASSSGNYAASPNTWNASYDKTNSSGADTAAKTATVARFTVQQILDSGITSLRYVSHLAKPVYTYQYEITYHYNSRFWGAQSYTQTGTCEDGDFTGSKTTAKLTTDFIIGKTPYEKSFRQQIDWNYTTTAVPAASGTGNVGASAMENNVATDQGSNTYKMTADVYASKTVNDKVTAEFVLPYKYNDKNSGYTVQATDVYTAANGNKSGTSYLYDTGNESVTLTTSAYKLFTYDDAIHGGSDDTLASSLPLMEAAPYLMTNLGDNDYHYKLTDNMRYYTGKSFKVGDTTYYKSQDDVPAGATNYQVLTGSNSVTFTKIKYAGTDHTTTYHYAVEDTSGGQKGQYGYKIYFFSYVTNEEGDYLDNNGNKVNSPTFNGQYCVYSVGREKDGIIAGTGVKKYFTRWDIYNTKGEFVASCYNRRFSYSGYDNYVVRPVYDSNTENSYASTLGDGYKSTITYLDDSRNQWKGTNASGTYASTTNQSDLYAADKLFTDFAITYNYNGQNINKVKNLTQDSANGANIRVGMVIERLDELDNVGTSKITSASYYADKYKGDTNWQNLAGRLAGTESGTLTSAVTSGHMCYNSKIGANYAVDGYTLFNSAAPGAVSGQTSVIDNFNRLQWFYTINNSTQRTSEEATATVTEMKNYAYRAISYIIVTDSTGTHATLTDTPAYFTIYDTATRTGN